MDSGGAKEPGIVILFNGELKSLTTPPTIMFDESEGKSEAAAEREYARC